MPPAVRAVVEEAKMIVEEGWTRMDEQVCQTMIEQLKKWIAALEGAYSDE